MDVPPPGRNIPKHSPGDSVPVNNSGGPGNPPDQNSERLLEAGEGWIDKDNVAHLRIDAMPIEDTFTGYLQLTPRGKLPMKQDVSREA